MKRTKRLITLLLTCVMVLGLAACGGNGGNTPNAPANNTKVV